MKNTQDLISVYLNDNWLEFSKNTINAYKINLNQFFRFCNKEYHQIKPEDVTDWIEDLFEAGWAANTIRQKVSTVSSFYLYCIDEDLVSNNPTAGIERPELGDSPPSFLTRGQLIQLKLEARLNMRDRVLIETLYVTGTRVSECLQIKVSDIKWQAQIIQIRKGKGNKPREVLINTECAERLKKYLETREIDSSYLFPNKQGKPLSRNWVATIFGKYSEIIGFKVTPHMLRHTLGTYLAEKEMSVAKIQKLFGHADISTTGIYTELSEEARQRQHEQYS